MRPRSPGSPRGEGSRAPANRRNGAPPPRRHLADPTLVIFLTNSATNRLRVGIVGSRRPASAIGAHAPRFGIAPVRGAPGTRQHFVGSEVPCMSMSNRTIEASQVFSAQPQAPVPAAEVVRERRDPGAQRGREPAARARREFPTSWTRSSSSTATRSTTP